MLAYLELGDHRRILGELEDAGPTSTRFRPTSKHFRDDADAYWTAIGRALGSGALVLRVASAASRTVVGVKRSGEPSGSLELLLDLDDAGGSLEA